MNKHSRNEDYKVGRIVNPSQKKMQDVATISQRGSKLVTANEVSCAQSRRHPLASMILEMSYRLIVMSGLSSFLSSRQALSFFSSFHADSSCQFRLFAWNSSFFDT